MALPLRVSIYFAALFRDGIVVTPVTKGPSCQSGFEGLLDLLCRVAALIEPLTLPVGLGKGWRFLVAAVMPVRLMEVQEGDENYLCIKTVKTCQQRCFRERVVFFVLSCSLE